MLTLPDGGLFGPGNRCNRTGEMFPGTGAEPIRPNNGGAAGIFSGDPCPT